MFGMQVHMLMWIWLEIKFLGHRGCYTCIRKGQTVVHDSPKWTLAPLTHESGQLLLIPVHPPYCHSSHFSQSIKIASCDWISNSHFLDENTEYFISPFVRFVRLLLKYPEQLWFCFTRLSFSDHFWKTSL